MAFSLDSIVTENKGWICLQPIVFEEAVGYFLANHHMERVSGYLLYRTKAAPSFSRKPSI